MAASRNSGGGRLEDESVQSFGSFKGFRLLGVCYMTVAAVLVVFLV